MTHTNHAAVAARRGERGAATVEVAILTPVLLTVIGFVIFVGRIGSLSERVQTASRDGARAASLERTPLAASTASQQATTASLTDHRIACENFTVRTDTTGFQPGGTVTVTVSCTVSLSNITGFGLPGTKTISSTSTEVIDTYRSVDDGFSNSEGSTGPNSGVGGS